MAWLIVPSKGPHAPCNPPNCLHRDCAELVSMIRAECPYCEDIIGFDTEFTTDEDGDLCHFVCLLKHYES